MKKETRGGKRKGAGRRKAPDKKQRIELWFYESLIKLHGGKKEFKDKIYKHFNKK